MTLGINEIVYIVLGVCILFYAFMLLLVKRNKKQQKQEKTGVVEKKNVRYTVEDKPVEKVNEETGETEAQVTFEKEDIILRRGYKYVVGPHNKIKPGKYTLLSSEESIEEFNIRRNAYVRSYDHNSNVILAEGDEITCINIPVILR